MCDVENAKSSSTPGAEFCAGGPKFENEASNMAPCSAGISVDWAARRLRAAAEFGFNFLACDIMSVKASESLDTHKKLSYPVFLPLPVSFVRKSFSSCKLLDQ